MSTLTASVHEYEPGLVGHERSTQAHTKGKTVAVYAAGPNWKPETPAVQGK